MFQSMSCCIHVSNLKPKTLNPEFVQVTRESLSIFMRNYKYNVVVQPTMDTAFIFSLVIILDIKSKDNNAPPPPTWDTFQLGTHPFEFRKAASSYKT